MSHPERKQNRLMGYDYSQNGAYFITVCVKDRAEIFTVFPDWNRTKDAVTPWIDRSSSAAWAEATRISGIFSSEQAMAQLL